MKISISKNKEGIGYFTTIKNKFNDKEIKCYIPVNIPKDVELEEFGVYDVDMFLSCYEAKDGTIKPKIVVKGFKQKEEPQKTNSEIVAEVMKEDPYEAFGKQIEIDEEMLPF